MGGRLYGEGGFMEGRFYGGEVLWGEVYGRGRGFFVYGNLETKRGFQGSAIPEVHRIRMGGDGENALSFREGFSTGMVEDISHPSDIHT